MTDNIVIEHIDLMFHSTLPAVAAVVVEAVAGRLSPPA
jgi:hypothetical protein